MYMLSQDIKTHCQARF